MALLILPAWGCDGLVDGPKGIVRAVTDGDTLILDNGLVVRLVGIQAPKLALGRPDLSDWPLGEAAKAALAKLALNQPAQLRYGGGRLDRYGRALAQVFIGNANAVWAQEAMLADGMARVYSFPDNRACVTELLAVESAARLSQLGIWSDPYYRVLSPATLEAFAPLDGDFELVEGRVLKAAKSGTRLYLNFGRRWKDDVTAVIEAKALALFAKAGIDPLKFEGAVLRLRGFVEQLDGPRLTITHPEQIEVLASQ